MAKPQRCSPGPDQPRRASAEAGWPTLQHVAGQSRQTYRRAQLSLAAAHGRAICGRQALGLRAGVDQRQRDRETQSRGQILKKFFQRVGYQ